MKTNLPSSLRKALLTALAAATMQTASASLFLQDIELHYVSGYDATRLIIEDEQNYGDLDGSLWLGGDAEYDRICSVIIVNSNVGDITAEIRAMNPKGQSVGLQLAGSNWYYEPRNTITSISGSITATNWTEGIGGDGNVPHRDCAGMYAGGYEIGTVYSDIEVNSFGGYAFGVSLSFMQIESWSGNITVTAYPGDSDVHSSGLHLSADVNIGVLSGNISVITSGSLMTTGILGQYDYGIDSDNNIGLITGAIRVEAATGTALGIVWESTNALTFGDGASVYASADGDYGYALTNSSEAGLFWSDPAYRTCDMTITTQNASDSISMHGNVDNGVKNFSISQGNFTFASSSWIANAVNLGDAIGGTTSHVTFTDSTDLEVCSLSFYANSVTDFSQITVTSGKTLSLAGDAVIRIDLDSSFAVQTDKTLWFISGDLGGSITKSDVTIWKDGMLYTKNWSLTSTSGFGIAFMAALNLGASESVDVSNGETKAYGTVQGTLNVGAGANAIIEESLSGGGVANVSGGGALSLLGVTISDNASVVVSNGVVAVEDTTVTLQDSGKMVAKVGTNEVITLSGGTVTAGVLSSTATDAVLSGLSGTATIAITGGTGTLDNVTVGAGGLTVAADATAHLVTALTIGAGGLAHISGTVTGDTGAGVVVGSGGTLSGSGSFGNKVTVAGGGTIIVGNSPGHQTYNQLEIGGTGTGAAEVVFSIDGANAATGASGWGSGEFARISINGTGADSLVIAADTIFTFELSLDYLATLNKGDLLSFDIITFAAATADIGAWNTLLGGITINFAEGLASDGITHLTGWGVYNAELALVNLTGDDYAIQFTANYIPEPTTATLGVLGLAGLLLRRRRTNK